MKLKPPPDWLFIVLGFGQLIVACLLGSAAAATAFAGGLFVAIGIYELMRK